MLYWSLIVALNRTALNCMIVKPVCGNEPYYSELCGTKTILWQRIVSHWSLWHRSLNIALNRSVLNCVVMKPECGTESCCNELCDTEAWIWHWIVVHWTVRYWSLWVALNCVILKPVCGTESYCTELCDIKACVWHWTVWYDGLEATWLQLLIPHHHDLIEMLDGYCALLHC